MDEEPEAKEEGLCMRLARLVAQLVHAVVTEFRELDMEPEPQTKTTPTGFVIPERRIAS